MKNQKTLVTGYFLATVLLFAPNSFAKPKDAKPKDVKAAKVDGDIEAIVNAQDKIKDLGFSQALKSTTWVDVSESDKLDGVGAQYGYNFNWDDPTLPSDYCVSNPMSSDCTSYYPGGSNSPVMNLKNDGVQILATEVLYQTLTFFKVKHVFGKLKDKPNAWAFKVIEPAEGGYFQDLDSVQVVNAIRQFRKYVYGLLCNEPNPSRMLAMMNRFDVGKRFRWDMAWALLGNDLPDAPNKYMKFGLKWRRFSMAMDGIENGSMLRVRNAFGGQTGVDPGGWDNPAPTQPNPGTGSSSLARVGYVAREVISIIRLVGDIAAATFELFCISDLTVSQQKETEKQNAVYKLLDVKKKALDHYGPLRSVLDELGKKATEAAGQPITLTP